MSGGLCVILATLESVIPQWVSQMKTPTCDDAVATLWATLPKCPNCFFTPNESINYDDRKLSRGMRLFSDCLTLLQCCYPSNDGIHSDGGKGLQNSRSDDGSGVNEENGRVSQKTVSRKTVSQTVRPVSPKAGNTSPEEVKGHQREIPPDQYSSNEDEQQIVEPSIVADGVPIVIRILQTLVSVYLPPSTSIYRVPVKRRIRQCCFQPLLNVRRCSNILQKRFYRSYGAAPPITRMASMPYLMALNAISSHRFNEV